MRTRALASMIAALSLACSGEQGPPGGDGQSAAMRTASEPAGANCAAGGIRVETGIDDDGDGSLGDLEVDATVYVCDGAAGQSVSPAPEDPGTNCLHGGVMLTPDGGTPFFVCNGAPGESVTVTPEPAGANCEFGGVKVQVGTEPATYVCNGVPSGLTLPTVETALVTDVRYVEAVVDGNVTDDGGEIVLVRGVVLATHAGPTLRDTLYLSGTGAGPFATLCDGLDPATTYFVRAFATNALGTSYGEERSFTTRALTVPTVTTLDASNVTHSTAIAGGNVTDDGGTPILGRGICWSLAPDPGGADACAPEGEGAGSFIALATGLSADTTYHVRAYAVNAQGTSFGEDLTFTTGVLPLAVVTTAAPTAVSYTTATGGGTVVSDNGSPVTTRGICWATTPAPTTAGTCTAEAGGVGTFTASMTGLAAGTTYHLRAYALNGGGTSYGNEVSLTTLTPAVPSITTKAVSGISSYFAGSGGVIATDGGSPITAKGVCWSLNPGPTVANSRTNDGTGPSSFNSTLTGLEPLTTYHVRAYATNALGTAYGNELSFTTTDLVSPEPSVPVVGTSTPIITGSSTASSGGYVSNDGGSEVAARGVCWSTAQNPTLADSCSSDGAGVGFFSSTVTGLGGCGVVYYVRAYATNATGTGYGNQATLSTGLLPTVATATVTDIGYYEATSGGTIPDDGGCPITQKGIVWHWNPHPVLGHPGTAEGSGSDPFVSAITGLYANRTYYVRAYATNSVGTAYGPQEVFVTAEPSTPYLGQSYAGGIVFHVDGTGLHGLVAAPTDQAVWSAPWGCQGTSIPTGTALGTGPTNTAAIVASCADASSGARIADALVLNGYDDWFLPSRDELGLMFTNLQAQGLGGLGGHYWSSSQADASSAFSRYSGGSYLFPKSYGLYVRAARAF
jgi:hypothetical protein